ncbi:MAG: TAT-variant-translocated molybdopterin oxidoreductase [Deltaproteobacteria bacterium]|nr:TAT-variant-translocated molybdopterin oxidoreductase [Deltaproteobacteria bacterium]
MEKKVWKSLEELREDPALREQNADEFPEWSASRRDFLKIMGFGLGTVAMVACTRSPVHKAIPFLQKPEELTPGVANWYATTCAGCSAGCSLLVKNRDGRPIKVEGNPESPLNEGAVCAVGQASLLSLYDGSRLKEPRWSGSTIGWEGLDERVRDGLNAATAAGRKVALLTGTVVSPTTLALIGEFLAKFPGAQHVAYDPVSAKAIREANRKSFGAAVLPRYRFDLAERIVGLQADFLGSWISPVEFTRQYVSRRKLKPGVAPSRHVQIESDFSLTGSNAELRIPILPAQTLGAALSLLAEIQGLAGGANLPDFPKQGLPVEKIREVAKDLWRHRGASLVVSGSNEIGVQSVVNAINSLLGNIGKTVDLDAPSLQKQGDEAAFAGLVTAMKKGEVGALFVEGVNPAYDNPLAADFREALKQVPLSLSFSPFPDETSAAVRASAPGLHFLEAWGDAEPQAGLFHLTQPLIAPLFDNRSFQDSLLKWMGAGEDFYRYLQARWEKTLFPKQGKFFSFRDFWNHSLHDGVFRLSGSDPQAKALVENPVEAARAALAAQGGSVEGLQLQAYESIALRAGTDANNPWLQELPDPVTKVTWGNVLKLAPAEAARQGWKDGDMVRIKTNQGQFELPVFLQPGMPAKAVSAALGYGRSEAGKVGKGVGGNFYPVLTFVDGYFRYVASGIQLEATGRHQRVATTQTHSNMEGRAIVRDTTYAEYKNNPRAGNEDRPKLISLWPAWKEGPHSWGMAIDLNACTGCSGCLIGCQVENNVPVVGEEEVWRRREMGWIRIDRYYVGPEDNPETLHQPMMCQHCGNAPCETVCPVLATVHSSDGLNQQVYNRCVGTRYCANNCPYKVRRFNWFDYADNPDFDFNLNDQVAKLALNPDITVRTRGVMEKCSMCVQRIQEGKLKAKNEGRKLEDGEIQMACQQSCPGKAIVFGDLNDPESEISKLLKDERYYAVLEELNVQPAVGYLTKVRNKD